VGHKISPEDLCKILEDHKNSIRTHKKEGKRANLSGAKLYDADLRYAKLSDDDLSCANITQVKKLSINKLSKVKTLYKAKLDPELIEQVKDKYPHLLEEPKFEE